jgi:hypothetical protein
MNKIIALLTLISVSLLTGCKTIDFREVRAQALQGNPEAISSMQSAYLQISPSSRMLYMMDLAGLQQKFPREFAMELAKQKPKTQQAVGYLLQGAKEHRSLLEKISRTQGSNNSP